MQGFAELGVSVFDDAFTLDPYPALEELYARPDILGFTSEGMRFLFRHDQARSVMFSAHCQRPGLDGKELQAMEQRYARLYPDRAWFLQRSYTQGSPDLSFKAAMGRFIVALSAAPDLDRVGALLEPLGREESGPVDYIDIIATLPLRFFLDNCGLPYDDGDLAALHAAGTAWLKSFENFQDHALLARGDRGMALMRDFVSERFAAVAESSPLQALIRAGRSSGLDDSDLVANIAGIFLAGMSNTVGMSSAFALRTLLQNREVWQRLRSSPELIQSDAFITALLRCDNHVKALARQARRDLPLGRFALEAGDIVFLFFPGINRDPSQWDAATALSPHGDSASADDLVFGGAHYTCIGRKLAMAMMRHLLTGYVRYLPASSRVHDDQIEVDGSWISERIITRLPVDFVSGPGGA